MSCIACEFYAKRITNIFRDDELSIKYLELTGCQISKDCFICDDCLEKLEASYTFRRQCIEIYRKLNPLIDVDIIPKINEIPLEIPKDVGNAQEIFIIREDLGEDNQTFIAEHITDEEMVDQLEDIVKPTENPENEEEYEDYYMEYEVDGKEEYLDEIPPEQTTSPPNSKPTKSRRKQDHSESQDRPAHTKQRRSYTVEEKLKIIEFAEEHNNRVAARNFKINESTVRCFRRCKETLLRMCPKKKTNRRGQPYWPDLEMELKLFVENYEKIHGTKAKLTVIKEMAIEIAASHGISNFNGSNSYIFKFMQRNHLPSASPRPRKIKPEVKAEDPNSQSSILILS